jgi:hypothetical protein
MASHKYKIGETITFAGPQRGRSAAPGEYEIVDYRPQQDGEPVYLIKSVLEKHQRIARESDLKNQPTRAKG